MLYLSFLFLQLELLFEEDFGCPPSRLFRQFDPEPVAAASLAQVFKAETHDGERVAIKAQYIDLRDRYDGDIWTVKVLLKMVAAIHPKFSLSWIFEVIKALCKYFIFPQSMVFKNLADISYSYGSLQILHVSSVNDFIIH